MMSSNKFLLKFHSKQLQIEFKSIINYCLMIDTHLQVYLLPDKSKNGKRKTKVKKHTLNPVFDETLKYYMPLNSLESRTLWLTVWHSDMFGRNDFLGEVTINLQGKVFDNPQPQWYSLQERVSICFEMRKFHLKSFSVFYLKNFSGVFFVCLCGNSSLLIFYHPIRNRVNHLMTSQHIVVI